MNTVNHIVMLFNIAHADLIILDIYNLYIYKYSEEF